MSDTRPGAKYTPEIFDVRDIDEARRIILTAESGTTTDARWATETPWLADRILEQFPLTERQVVIDFGCGLGRMAKALIERTRCWVVGVDMSQGMRQLAPGYVQSPRFATVSPPMLDLMIARGFRAELAIAIWVLQHVAQPEADVGRLQRVLVPGGGVFVANNLRRAVPTDRGWAHDGIDVDALLARSFVPGWRSALPSEIGGDVLPGASFVGAYRNPQ
jgi:cyclopropane fatty-acyl-phospholipid synthase-like methyltransferase